MRYNMENASALLKKYAKDKFNGEVTGNAEEGIFDITAQVDNEPYTVTVGLSQLNEFGTEEEVHQHLDYEFKHLIDL